MLQNLRCLDFDFSRSLKVKGDSGAGPIGVKY